MRHILLAIVAVSLTVCSSNRYSGRPYSDSEYTAGMQTIPGRLYCAYYDTGGEGVAYHDATAENLGSGSLNPVNGSYLHSFRIDEGVDISYTKSNDTDNSGFNLVEPPMDALYTGWTEPGEWLKYSVHVGQSGKYRVGLMYTSNRGGKISISVDDKDATGPLSVTSTYDEADTLKWRQWHHWNRIDGIAVIDLKEGDRTITLHTVEEGQMNYMWLDFELIK